MSKKIPNLTQDELTVIKPFAALSAEGLKRAISLAVVSESRSGRFIIRAGTAGDEILFLLEGKAKVCRADTNGKEVILGLMGPGDMMGEIALLISGPRTADVIALTKCRLALFSHNDFLALLQTETGLGLGLLKSMAARLKNASERMADLALHDVNLRVSRVLVEMSVPKKIEGEDVLVIPERPTHQILGNMVGASRETVTRALHELEGLGHIAIEGERVIIYSMPE